MTNEKQTDDGGAAFPHLNPNYDGLWDKNPQRGGMSIRDYFAAAALTGLLGQRQEKGDPDRPASEPMDDDCVGLVYMGSYIAYQGNGDEYEAARDAYKFADAMLQARKESHE